MGRKHSLADWDLVGWSKLPWQDNDEIVAALGDPRYKSHVGGEAFRAACDAKFALSITDAVGHSPEQENYQPTLDHTPVYRSAGLSTKIVNEFTGQRDAQAEAAQKADLAEAARQLGAVMGPLAVKPSTEVIGAAEPFQGLPIDV